MSVGRLLISALLVLLITVQQVSHVKSSATFQFVATYLSPTNTTSDGSCCSVPCSSPCTSLQYITCVSSTPIKNCVGLKVQSSTSLPSITYAMSAWSGEIHAVIGVVTRSSSQSRLVDQFIFDYTATSLFTPDPSNTQVIPQPSQGPLVNRNLTGLRLSNPTTLFYSANITCDSTFYGRNCTTVCVIPADRCGGNFVCDQSTGNRTCASGWTGSSCKTPVQSFCPVGFVPRTPLSNANCTINDVVFIIYNSSKTSPANGFWNISKQIIRSFVRNVNYSDYQFSVVTYSDSAQLAIPLQPSSSVFISAVDRLPFSVGSGLNVRRGLSVARTDAFAFSKGARPAAYRMAVLFWTGDLPGTEYGTVTDEASRLTNSGVDVFIVTTSAYLSDNRTLALSSLIASNSTNIFVVDRSLGTADIAASLAVEMQMDCQRFQAAKTQNTNTNSSLSTASGQGSVTTMPSVFDSCCYYRGYWNPNTTKCCCQTGFAGDNCEYSVDPCNGNPCNIGNCITNGTTYNCVCPIGFAGANCETVLSGPVVINGTTGCGTSCISIPCLPNYYNPPACSVFCLKSDTCREHFDCNPVNGSRICMTGWSGAYCNISISSSTQNVTDCCSSGGIWLNGNCSYPASTTFTQTTIAMTSTTPPTTTTIDIVAYLIDYINKNFEYLSDLEKLQLLANLLQEVQNGGSLPRALSTEIVPIWVSNPWQGTGALANYTVRLEVLSIIVLPNIHSPRQLYVKYDFLLTDANGVVKRISPEDYDQLSYVDTISVSVDVSKLDESNQFSVILYGTYLSEIEQSLISRALRKAFFLADSVWRALNGSTVVMGTPDELLGPSGEQLTRCKFWLLSDNLTQHNPSTVNRPVDVDLVKALASYGIKSAVYSSPVFFNLADSFGLYVNGVVLTRDLIKFQGMLSAAWKHSAVLSSYANYSLSVLTQEKYFSANGSLHCRLVYFLHTGNLSQAASWSSFSVLNRQTTKVSPPTAEELLPYLEQVDFNGTRYSLVPSGNGTLYAAKRAFNLLVTARPVGLGTVDELTDQMQTYVTQKWNSSDYRVRLVTYEETLSEQKMSWFIRIYVYISVNGTIVDARRNDFFNPSALSIDVTLPNDTPLSAVDDDTAFDNLIPLSDCFSLVTREAATNYTLINAALTSSLRRKYSFFASSDFNVSAAVVGNVEYVELNGSSITQLPYVIKLWYSNYVKYLYASQYPEFALKAEDVILDRASVVNSNVLTQRNFERYTDLYGFYLSPKPLSFQVKSLTANVTQSLKGKLGDSVSCTFIRFDEQRTYDQLIAWRAVFRVQRDNLTVLPELISDVTSDDISFTTPRGDRFEVLGNYLIGSVRSTDLYNFYVNLPISYRQFSAINGKLTASFQSIFPQWPSIYAVAFDFQEIVVCPRCFDPGNIFRIGVLLKSNQWTLSSKKYPNLPSAAITSLFASFNSPNGRQYISYLSAPTTSVSLSQVFSILISRPVVSVDYSVVEWSLDSALRTVLPPAIGNLNVSLVQQVEVKQCSIEGGLLASSFSTKYSISSGSRSSLWAVNFLAAVGSDKIYADALPTNLINQTSLQSQLSAAAQILAVDVDANALVNSKSGMTLTFNRQPSPLILTNLTSFVQRLQTAEFNGSTVRVSYSPPTEVVSVDKTSTSSLWQVWFLIVVDGTPLNNLVDKPINVTKFNQLVAQEWTVDWTALTVPDNATVSVDNCLKIHAVGYISTYDFDSLSTALTDALNGVVSNQVSVKVTQAVPLTSVNGDSYTEIRAIVTAKSTGHVIGPWALPTINVTNLKVQLRNADSMLVQDVTSLELYPKSAQYSFALTSPIIDVDVVNVSYQLANLYASLAGYANSNVKIKILSQYEAVTLTRDIVVICSFVVLVNGSVQFEPSWVDRNGLISFPNKQQIKSALDNVYVATESGSTMYSSFLTSVNDSFVDYDAMVKIPLLQMVASSNFGAISSIVREFYLNIYSSGLFVQVLVQEDVVDSGGNFYNSLGLAILKADGTLVSAKELPLIDFQWLSLRLATVVTPSGVQLQAKDILKIGPVRRYKLGWSICLSQAIAISNITTLERVVTDVVPNGLKMTFGAQDKVVDELGQLSYKVTLFASRGSRIVDFRQLFPLDIGVLAAKFTVQLPGINITASGKNVAKLLTLRRCQRLFIQQFIKTASVSNFTFYLQRQWSQYGLSVAPNFFIEEFVGPNSQTVVAFSYFVAQGTELMDSSAIQPLGPNIVQVLSSINSLGFNYTLFTQSTFNLTSYSDSFKLYFAGPLDISDAYNIVNALRQKWLAYIGIYQANADVQLYFVGMKRSFGKYGIVITELVYSVSVNGVFVTNGFYKAPEFDASNFQSISAVTFYKLDTVPMRRDYLFTLILDGVPASRESVRLNLTSAWSKIRADATIEFRGVEQRVLLKDGVESTISVVYYLVMSGGKYLSTADVAAPTSYGLGLQLLSSTLQLQWIQLNRGLLSADQFNNIALAIKQAWINANRDLNSALFTIQISLKKKQQLFYSTSSSGFVVRLYYSVQYNGLDFSAYASIVTPRRDDIDLLLKQYSLSTCPCRAKKNNRLTISGSLSSSLRTAIQTSLTRVWRVKFADAVINVRISGGRSRRAANASSSDNTPVDFDVDVAQDASIDPPEDDFGDSQPSDADIAAALANDNIPVCAGCIVPTCSQLVVSGSSSAVSITSFQQAIVRAYIDANQLDSSTSISANASAGDTSSGRTCVSYCIFSNATVLATPSDNITGSALSAVGLTYIPGYSVCIANGTSSTNEGMLVIIIVVPLAIIGIMAIIAVSVLIILRPRKTPTKPIVPYSQQAPTQVVAGNPYVARGMFSRSDDYKFGTLHRDRGVYITRIPVPRGAP